MHFDWYIDCLHYAHHSSRLTFLMHFTWHIAGLFHAHHSSGSRSKKALLVVSAFLCTFLRVHDFIYGRAGRRAWLIGYRSEKRRFVLLDFSSRKGFGYRKPGSQIRYKGFSLIPLFLGTAVVFLRIVPFGSLCFGHSDGFWRNRSKFILRARGTFHQKWLPVPNLAS